MKINKTIFTICIILITYLCIAGYQLNLPGLHYDEAKEAGLLALQIVNHEQVTTFRNIGIGNNNFPLMVQDYIGALHVYFTIPFIAIIGPTALGIRLPSILLGVITLIVNFGFIRKISTQKIALLSTTLLAIHPSFVFWSRQGTLVASITLIFMLALLWICYCWYTNGKWTSALLIGLFAGLGIYSKFVFIWILGAILGITIIMNLKNLVYKQYVIWPKR